MEKSVEGETGIKKTLTPEVLVSRIGDTLVRKGYLSEQQLQVALSIQEKIRLENGSAPLLGQILVNFGYVDRLTLDNVITEQVMSLRSALQEANARLEERVMERTRELEEAMEKLSQLNQAKSNFVANISHELRTPLTHLKGYIDLLIQQDLGPLSHEQDDALQVMQRASNRLEQLIEDLIRFSMSERGDITLHPQEFDITSACRTAIKSLEEKANTQQIDIKFSCPENFLLVYADMEKISWVLHHLIDNSIKFTSQGGQVTLAVEQDGMYARISLSDTGIGIPDDKIESIFEPFLQVDGSTTRKFGGVGLGLALAAKIIESHGSTIQVVSSLGKGSRFNFMLPLANQQVKN